MKKKNKKKSVVDRINERQMRVEWDYATREFPISLTPLKK